MTEAAAQAQLHDDSWLIDAADLLALPDPGPTPYLVENLIVDRALIAAVGRWKTTKSYGLLDIAISVVTGLPAFGQLEIPEPGPVVFVIEESGRDALWRRLDGLARGRAIDRERLRGLHLATNARVKLDDPEWQSRLVDVGQRIRPRAFVFDPLARMKAPARKENEQGDMAPLIEFLRELRDETAAAVAFVQHTGHNGEHMRGSSDLESVWETRLGWAKDKTGLVTIMSDHREAESGPEVHYRLSWDDATRTMRIVGRDDDVPERQRDRGAEVVKFLLQVDCPTTEEVARGAGIGDSEARRIVNSDPRIKQVECHPGRNANAKCWAPAEEPGPLSQPDSAGLDSAREASSPASDPTPRRGGSRDELHDGARLALMAEPALPANGRALLGDARYLEQLDHAREANAITDGERRQLRRLHLRVVRGRVQA
jgi:hypothetical protein